MPVLLAGYRGPYVERERETAPVSEMLPRRRTGRPTKADSDAIANALALTRANVARLRIA